MTVKINRTGGKPDNIENMNIRDVADFMAEKWHKDDLIDKTLDEWSDWFPDILRNIGGAEIVEYLVEHYDLPMEYDEDRETIIFAGEKFKHESTYTWHQRIESKFRYQGLLAEDVRMYFNDIFALAEFIALNPDMELLWWTKTGLSGDYAKSETSRLKAWDTLHSRKVN
jgi:hypothetical protein